LSAIGEVVGAVLSVTLPEFAFMATAKIFDDGERYPGRNWVRTIVILIHKSSI